MRCIVSMGWYRSIGISSITSALSWHRSQIVWELKSFHRLMRRLQHSSWSKKSWLPLLYLHCQIFLNHSSYSVTLPMMGLELFLAKVVGMWLTSVRSWVVLSSIIVCMMWSSMRWSRPWNIGVPTWHTMSSSYTQIMRHWNIFIAQINYYPDMQFGQHTFSNFPLSSSISLES
jgi:hypothetical protein